MLFVVSLGAAFFVNAFIREKKHMVGTGKIMQKLEATWCQTTSSSMSNPFDVY